jgi:hypothetical protein
VRAIVPWNPAKTRGESPGVARAALVKTTKIKRITVRETRLRRAAHGWLMRPSGRFGLVANVLRYAARAARMLGLRFGVAKGEALA